MVGQTRRGHCQGGARRAASAAAARASSAGVAHDERFIAGSCRQADAVEKDRSTYRARVMTCLSAETIPRACRAWWPRSRDVAVTQTRAEQRRQPIRIQAERAASREKGIQQIAGFPISRRANARRIPRAGTDSPCSSQCQRQPYGWIIRQKVQAAPLSVKEASARRQLMARARRRAWPEAGRANYPDQSHSCAPGRLAVVPCHRRGRARAPAELSRLGGLNQSMTSGGTRPESHGTLPPGTPQKSSAAVKGVHLGSVWEQAAPDHRRRQMQTRLS